MTSASFAQLLQEYGAGADPIPDGGPYDFQVIGGKVILSRTNPPKHMIQARLKVLTGPYANRTTVHNFVLSPDNGGAMFHWFRNFGILGLSAQYWAQLTIPVEQALPQVVQAIQNRTFVGSLETSNGRQNVNFLAESNAPATAPPQAPQPGYGMQPGAPVQQYPQVQAPVQPGFPQPQVGPPGMVPQPQVQPVAPAAAAPQQAFPTQPMAAPPPVGGVAPQPTPQAPATQPLGQATQPGFPTPPGYPQQPEAQPQVPTQPGTDYPGFPGSGAPQQPAQPQFPTPPGMPQDGQPVQPQPGVQQPLPVPGTPPPQIPV
jgi:hypothetical protein